MDGPFSTSTREIFNSEHVVLIASGIGATPFASILQSIANIYNERKRQCPECDHTWYAELRDKEGLNLKTVSGLSSVIHSQ